MFVLTSHLKPSGDGLLGVQITPAIRGQQVLKDGKVLKCIVRLATQPLRGRYVQIASLVSLHITPVVG